MATNSRRKLVVTSNTAQTQSGAYETEDVATDEFTGIFIVPVPIRLTLTNHVEVHYAAGVRLMPLEHGENWFAKAAGVVPAPKGFVPSDLVPHSTDEQFSEAEAEALRAQAAAAAEAQGSPTDPAAAPQTGEQAPA